MNEKRSYFYVNYLPFCRVSWTMHKVQKLLVLYINWCRSEKIHLYYFNSNNFAMVFFQSKSNFVPNNVKIEQISLKKNPGSSCALV